MNLIDRAARLKEQQATEASATYQAASDEFRYECDMLNAAPTLLEVLGGFRPGDAAALDEIASLLEDSCLVSKAAYVRRMRVMATKMEAER